MGVTESKVRELGRAGFISPDKLALGIEDEGVCGRCLRNIDTLVDLAVSEWNSITAHPVEDCN